MASKITATYKIDGRTIDVVANWDDNTPIDYDFFDLFEGSDHLNLGNPLYTEDNQTPNEVFVRNALTSV